MLLKETALVIKFKRMLAAHCLSVCNLNFQLFFFWNFDKQNHPERCCNLNKERERENKMNSIKSASKSLIVRSLIASQRRFNQTSTAELNRRLKERNGAKNGTIYITQSAINRLKKILSDKEALRVSIDSGGCKGFNYIFKVEETIDKEDKVFEVENSKIVIDQESYDFVKESILDYNDELIKSSFRIKDNPQNSDSCSCGVSFSPKIFWEHTWTPDDAFQLHFSQAG